MAEPDFSLGQASGFIAEELPAALSADNKVKLRTSTSIAVTNSGVEHRQGYWAAPLAEIDIGPAVRSLYTLGLLESFYRRTGGPRDSFLYHNPRLHSTGAVTASAKTPGAISSTDVVLGAADGVTTDFQLIRTYGSATQNIYKTKTLLVAVDGVLQDPNASPPDYTVSSSGVVQFTSAPASGNVTAGFTHYLVVRFRDDELPLEFATFSEAAVPILLQEVRDFA